MSIEFPSMHHSRQTKRSRGFTLVELTVTILLIGILSSIVVVSFSGVLTTSKDKAVTEAVARIGRAATSAKMLNSDLSWEKAVEEVLPEQKVILSSSVEKNSTKIEFVIVDILADPAVPGELLVSDMLENAVLATALPSGGSVWATLSVDGSVNTVADPNTPLVVHNAAEPGCKPHGVGGNDVFEIVQNKKKYRVHVYTAVGASSFQVRCANSLSVEYLVVAGGGSGGEANDNIIHGGGGGAGGLLTNTQDNPLPLPVGSHTTTVGAGGVKSPGQNSSIGNYVIAIGGGRGGNWGVYNTLPIPSANGGSGGGRGSVNLYSTVEGGTAVSGQGNPGGSNYYRDSGGGGGGAQTAGSNSANSTPAGNSTGGAGYASSIVGVQTFYAAGGGGGGGGALGGSGIGGQGGSGTVAATPGRANTGSGGGGGRASGVNPAVLPSAPGGFGNRGDML